MCTTQHLSRQQQMALATLKEKIGTFPTTTLGLLVYTRTGLHSTTLQALKNKGYIGGVVHANGSVLKLTLLNS